ncbi:TPA: membrane protein insertion efficiency factor YidD [Patescibacteria group bacterium]|nr:membrane protein insertion efficiency factor YidD [Patescibacteria group bacterium]
MKQMLIFSIRLYRQLRSPFFSGTCRFAPSCSQYTEEAIRKHGIIKGLWFGSKRLLRCHPGNRGGYDPVPLRG